MKTLVILLGLTCFACGGDPQPPAPGGLGKGDDPAAAERAKQIDSLWREVVARCWDVRLEKANSVGVGVEFSLRAVCDKPGALASHQSYESGTDLKKVLQLVRDDVAANQPSSPTLESPDYDPQTVEAYRATIIRAQGVKLTFFGGTDAAGAQQHRFTLTASYFPEGQPWIDLRTEKTGEHYFQVMKDAAKEIGENLGPEPPQPEPAPQPAPAPESLTPPAPGDAS